MSAATATVLPFAAEYLGRNAQGLHEVRSDGLVVQFTDWQLDELRTSTDMGSLIAGLPAASGFVP